MEVYLGFLAGCIIGSTFATIPSDQNNTIISNNNFTDYLSEPIIKYNRLHNNTVHIICFSEFGPLPIHYELILGDIKIYEVTVHNKEPANFTFVITPGIITVLKLKCKASSNSGVAVSSDIVFPSVEDNVPTKEEKDDGGKDSGPDHLIALHYILTSVDREVQKRNTLLLYICGPIILLVLVIVIIITYIRNQREHHPEV